MAEEIGKGIDGAINVLTFKLNSEVFGIDIMSVKEVLDYTKITKVPRTPDYMLGVINLRGNVAPVVDLKMKFGMEATEKTIDTCIIIVEVMVDEEATTLGILADSVEEVIDFDEKDIEEAPKIGVKLNMDFIKCMAKKGDDFVIILDINKVFSSEEIADISGVTEQA